VIRAASLVVLLAAARPAAAGPLSDFEKQATKPDPPRAASASEDSPASRTHSDDDSNPIFDAIAEGAVYGGAASLARVETREPGEPLIPFARGDAGYQYIRGGPSALDMRGEAGWAFLALETRLTSYRDRRTDETLSALSVNGLYRMSFGSQVEIDLGAGSYSLQGEGRHAGSTFTVPIRVAATDWLGLEARPSWHFIGENTIRDHALSVRLGGRYAGFTAGYRWVESGSAKLDGPQIGLSLSW
jgi:hypothetical protein